MSLSGQVKSRLFKSIILYRVSQNNRTVIVGNRNFTSKHFELTQVY